MTTYDNFAHTFSESRKNMKWEEIEYFLTKCAPFGNILDVGCGNGRLLGELVSIIPNLIENPENIVGENKQQSIRNPRIREDDKILFSSYLGIDASEKLLEEARNIYNNVIPSLTGNLLNLVGENKQSIRDPRIREDDNKSISNFQLLDMRNISFFPENSFDSIFFIASFHHLETLPERFQVLLDTKNILRNGGKIYLTNWALESEMNREKYASSKTPGSENEFQSSDFQIKIGEFQRYYHSFTLLELETLATEAGFQILENRLFETEKNFITILEKK